MDDLDQLRQAVNASPNNVPLLLIFAANCVNSLAFDEARETFQKILALEPQHVSARIGLYHVLHLTGKTSEAVLRTEAFLQEHPRVAQGWLLLSRLLLAEGQTEQARQHFLKARSIDRTVSNPALEKELFPGATPPPLPTDAQIAAALAEDDDDDADPDDDDDSFLDDMEDDALEQPRLSFADVGGMDTVKEELRMKILYPLQNPDLFRAYGKKIGGGVLLYGPPGCGKTLLSRAVAGEMQASFISIGLHQILDLHLGDSEKNLHQIFELARDNKPAVLFFDEVDALAADRNDLKRSAGRTLINQFLAEMDGSVRDNDGLLILGATNAPWHIDPAFRRPGRFDRMLFVPPPDETARAAIITVMAKDKPVTNLDAVAVARKTKDFSGADLKQVFDVTIERCLTLAMKKGIVVPITTADLIQSAKDIKPSSKAWFESARNYALYANQSGFYDEVLSFLGLKK
ncbi:MAG: AAA family ATPase [Candidatus Methylacidiphilales bacterium]|nr:AAA family ATPase [Candidatus Methylacidiphilales bacterium]